MRPEQTAIARQLLADTGAHAPVEQVLGALRLLDVFPELWESFDVAIELVEDDDGWCGACGAHFTWADMADEVDDRCPVCGSHDLHNDLTTYNPLDGEYTHADIVERVTDAPADNLLVGVWERDPATPEPETTTLACPVCGCTAIEYVERYEGHIDTGYDHATAVAVYYSHTIESSATCAQCGTARTYDDVDAAG